VSKLQLRVVRRPSARCSLRRSLYLLATSLNRRCRLSCLPCLLPSVRLRLPSRALACCRPSCLYSSPPSGWTCPLSCHDLPRSPLPLPAPLLQRRPSPVGASSLVGHHRYCCCPDPLLSCCTVAIRHAARVNCSSSRSPPPLVLLPTGHAPYADGSWAVHSAFNHPHFHHVYLFASPRTNNYNNFVKVGFQVIMNPWTKAECQSLAE